MTGKLQIRQGFFWPESTLDVVTPRTISEITPTIAPAEWIEINEPFVSLHGSESYKSRCHIPLTSQDVNLLNFMQELTRRRLLSNSRLGEDRGPLTLNAFARGSLRPFGVNGTMHGAKPVVHSRDNITNSSVHVSGGPLGRPARTALSI